MRYTEKEMTSTSLYGRVSKLLESYEWSDCSFSVSGTHFKAHRLIMGISSPVFEAMFYGPLSSNDAIIIADIEPDIFQLLIHYIYTDKVEISSIEQAFELLYAAKKYLLEYLKYKCISYIEDNLIVDNVISVLEFSEYFQEESLILYTLKLFCEHATYLLHDNIERISCSSLKLVLKCDKINICERDLIKYVFKWAKIYCNLNNIPSTFDNKRKILNDNGLFKLLRFSDLSENDFEDIVIDENNLLSTSEIEDYKNTIVCVNLEQDSQDNLKVCAKRDTLKVRTLICHRSCLRSAAPLIIDAGNNTVNVRIRADKTIFVNSLSVPTRMSPEINFHNNKAKLYSEQFSVSVIYESDKSVIKFTNFINTVEYDSFVYIDFAEPCILRKNYWYVISFKWPNNGCHSYKYIVGQRDAFSNQKVNIQFEDHTDGSFLEGLRFSL